QSRVSQTGTITGKEFLARTRHEGPEPMTFDVRPADLVVAPGDFSTATRQHE
ncbi:MAG: NADH-quinone oxidoreductase subunit B, partial [Planctomycetes bacterium]|nr:NADH-quinone oxidoreductase subunit B [Planctomycetota bacterium]